MTSIGTNFGANVGEMAEAAIKGAKNSAKTAAVRIKGLNTTGLDSVTINMLKKAKEAGTPLETLKRFVTKRLAALKYDNAVQTAYRRQVAAQAHNTTYQVGTAFSRYMKDGETLKEGVELIKRSTLPATVKPSDMKNVTNMPIKDMANGAVDWIKGKGKTIVDVAKKHPVAAAAVAIAALGLGFWAIKKPSDKADNAYKEAA